MVSIRRILAFAAVLCSCRTPVLSFLRPQTCSISPRSRSPTMAKTCIVKRQAATAVPGGGVPNEKSEMKSAEQNKMAPSISAESKTTQQQRSQPLPPGDRNTSKKVVPGAVSAAAAAKATAPAAPAAGKGASPSETQIGGGAVTKPFGQRGKEAEVSNTAAGAKAAAVATAVRGADISAAAGKPVGSTDASVEQEETTATAGDKSTKKKKKGGLSAAPETTAAEKVLTLLDIGLVDKEEVAAYYEALSELERTTQEAKAATAAAATAASLNPQSASSSAPFTPQDGPLSLVPFPAVCAALGAAGTHSLHLTGGLGTALSVFGAMAGAALGSLVVIGDDATGRAARAAGSAVSRSASTAGGMAARSVSESVEEAVVKAPANFVAGLARSISNAVSAAVGPVVALPGELAAKAVNGAKGALQDTSEAVVKIPGELARNVVNLPVEVARQTAQAAGGALQSTTETAFNAVKESPKEAAKRLTEAVSAPGVILTDFVKGVSVGRAGKREQGEKEQPAAASVSPPSENRESKMAASSKEDESEPEGIPVEELEAKMLSVQEALKRFDAVKNRIEEAQTSDTLLETVGMTRSTNVSAENEKSEKARAATKEAKDIPVEKKEVTGSRRSSTPASKPRVTPSDRKPIDQNRRKHVAERLLEKASQRATEAKAGLKAAAASARGEAEMADVAHLTAAGAEQKAPQETVASP